MLSEILFVAAGEFVSFTTQGRSGTAAIICSIQQDPHRMNSNFDRFSTQ